jgi:hypothetical protein
MPVVSATPEVEQKAEARGPQVLGQPWAKLAKLSETLSQKQNIEQKGWV